eukprot:6419174-Ditylum_brightwellii.AAC.1
MAEVTVSSTSPAWRPSSHRSMRCDIRVQISLDWRMPGVVCKTTAMNTITCSEFQCCLRAPTNSAVRIMVNILPTGPLGTLYQLVGRLTILHHQLCHAASSGTPPSIWVPSLRWMVSPKTCQSFASVGASTKPG